MAHQLSNPAAGAVCVCRRIGSTGQNCAPNGWPIPPAGTEAAQDVSDASDATANGRKRQAKAASASTVATLPQQLFLLPETDLETVLLELESLQPKVAIIDSIQALYYGALTSAPGSVSQVRECTSALMQLAKRADISLFIVGHVTKEGAIAGPKVLEHLVDTVLYFEGGPLRQPPPAAVCPKKPVWGHPRTGGV